MRPHPFDTLLTPGLRNRLEHSVLISCPTLTRLRTLELKETWHPLVKPVTNVIVTGEVGLRTWTHDPRLCPPNTGDG